MRSEQVMNRIAFTVFCFAVAAGAYAHHSAAPHFDMDNPVTVEGVITELRLVNPHAYVYFDVTDDAGEVANWRCELAGGTGMRRRGWTDDSLVPGQAFTMTGAPARREEHVCYTNFMEFEDGTRIARNDPPPGFEAVAAAEDTPAASQEWTAYLPNGQPNLGGPWVRQGMGGGMGPPPGGMGAPAGGAGPDAAAPGGMAGGPPGGGMGGGFPAPTEAGLAAAADYEQPFDDPAIHCHPANIIFGFTHDSHVNDIYQTDDTVTIQYGYMDLVRTVHLDRTEHPDDIVPSVGGHSIGRWEGDVLVVDTVGFEQGVVFPLGDGLMHSADMQVTERFEVSDDGQTLVRAYVAHDPAFLQTDWVGESVFQRTSEPYRPYDCTELSGDNNRRPAPE